VYGLDEDGKPHAGKFSGGQREAVSKAAQAMGYKVQETEPDPVLAALPKLPAGRLYSNGRGFVPFIRRDSYAKLMATLGLAEPGVSEPASQPVIATGYPATGIRSPQGTWSWLTTATQAGSRQS
jgi:hypothetical protein